MKGNPCAKSTPLFKGKKFIYIIIDDTTLMIYILCCIWPVPSNTNVSPINQIIGCVLRIFCYMVSNNCKHITRKTNTPSPEKCVIYTARETSQINDWWQWYTFFVVLAHYIFCVSLISHMLWPLGKAVLTKLQITEGNKVSFYPSSQLFYLEVRYFIVLWPVLALKGEYAGG